MDNIVVCIKQVPDTCDIKWTAENNISREGMLSILNPCDEAALNWAVRLKEKTGAKVTAISMGPNQAKEVLDYALALGVDVAYLLSDKAFSASDTLATGRVLSSAIKKVVSNFDLILCGQMALDGDTAQTGATIANLLGIENISYAVDINIEGEKLVIKQELEDGYNVLSTNLPILVCVLEKSDKKSPKIGDYIVSQGKKINVLGINDIGIEKSECGILGSPTYVSKVFRKIANRKCEIIKSYNSDELLKKIKTMRENV